MHITNLYPYQNSVIGSLQVDELEVSHADIHELHAKHLDVNTAEVANITTSHLVATTADIDEVSINLLNILDTTLAEELNVDGDIKASGSVKLKTDPDDQDDTPYLAIGPNFNQPYTFSVSKDGTIQAKDVYMEAITVGDTIPNMTVQSNGLTTINTGTSAGKAISVTHGTSPTTEAVAISGDGSIILTPTGTGDAIKVGNAAIISKAGDITTSGEVSSNTLAVGSNMTVDNAGNITTTGTATVNALSVEDGGSEVASISSDGDISGKSLTLTDPSLGVGRTLKLGTGRLVTSSLFAGTAVCNYMEDRPITVSTFGTPGTFNVTSVGVTGNINNGFKEVFNDNSLCVLDTNNGPDGTSFVLSPGYHRFSVTTNFSVVSDTATHSRMFSIVVGAIPTNLPANTSIWYGFDSFTSFTDTDTEAVDVRRGMFVSKTFTFVVTCSIERRMRLGVMFGSKSASFNPPDSVKFSHRAIGPNRPSPNEVKALWNIVNVSPPIANPTVVQIDSWAINNLVDSEYLMEYPA